MTSPSPYQPARGLIDAIAIPAYQDDTERAAREAALNAPPQPQ